MKTLMVMVGLPGSGKSTYVDQANFARLHVDESNEERFYMVLSTDDYIEEKAKELGSTYTEVFQDYIKEAEANLKDRLKEALDNGYNIVWDQTNLRKKKRASILNSITSDYKKIAVEFITPIEEIMKRNKDRAAATGKFIAEHIINSMNESRERVTKDEGFDDIIVVEHMELVHWVDLTSV